ncbi:MAG: hypothetical protein OEW05_00835 [Candidatus Aminicenantes bacterium]|nr:hypothetical protein [Candidatus Aminicenantes bacterium]
MSAVVAKHEAAEGKRPYYRYALREKAIHITFDLAGLYDPKIQASAAASKIRERKNSGALFKEGRGERSG